MEVPTFYVGKINYFVKVVPPGATVGDVTEQDVVLPAESLRLAVMDLHLLQRIDKGVGVLYKSVTYCSGAAAYPNTALGLSWEEDSAGTIMCKQVLAKENGDAYFLPYSNMSASAGEDA